MPPKPKGKGRTKTPMGFPPISAEECDRAHWALNPGIDKSPPDGGSLSPPPDEPMPLVGATVPQKCLCPPKTPPNLPFNWADHPTGKPHHRIADNLPHVDAPHPPLPSPLFKWHKFFKDMEFASSNITSPKQSTAFCHILFNFLYRSVWGAHSTDFKTLQLDDTNPQAMITELTVTTLRVNSGCNERQRLEGDKAKSKLVKRKEYRVLLRYL
jgi:hypothetical protein